MAMMLVAMPMITIIAVAMSVTMATVFVTVLIPIAIVVVFVFVVPVVAIPVEFGCAHKINRSAASIIFIAKFLPVSGMSWRHVQIKRFNTNLLWRRRDQDRLFIYDRRRRCIANVDAAIYTWLNFP